MCLPVTAVLGTEFRIGFDLHIIAPRDEENFLSIGISTAGKWKVISLNARNIVF